MTYTYRCLSSADVDVLKDLMRVFGEAFNERVTYQGAVPSDQYLRRLLSRPHFIVLVALNDGEVVGGLAAYELEKFEQDRREIYIYDLAVAEQHRRRGIATNLIRELQRVARDRKAYVIYVQADREDDPAIRLYESLGTREDVHHFDILVEDRADDHDG
jgi:aminoglycoside 3-N-acetyltransferase I